LAFENFIYFKNIKKIDEIKSKSDKIQHYPIKRLINPIKNAFGKIKKEILFLRIAQKNKIKKSTKPKKRNKLRFFDYMIAVLQV
jgi:hypothetical protein